MKKKKNAAAVALGGKGGKQTKKLYGKERFSEIAKIRWTKEKKKATEGYTEDVV